MRSIVIPAIVIALIGSTPHIARAATYTLQQYPGGFVNVLVQRLQKDPKRVMERSSGIYLSWSAVHREYIRPRLARSWVD